MEKELAELNELCTRIYDLHMAGKIILPTDAVHGVTFEEVLGLLIDDFIPAAKEAA
jgi:hypothetical protein